jgi:hypothetical protein
MAGFTDFAVGVVRCQLVKIPFEVLERSETRILKRKDIDWQRLLMSTGQSNFLSPENQAIYKLREREEQLRRKTKYMDLKVKLSVGDLNSFVTGEGVNEGKADFLNY